MKKINLFLVCAFVLIWSTAITQSNRRLNASNYVKEGLLDRALEEIEAVCIHEKTKGQAKSWNVRGIVYAKIAKSDNPKYMKLHETPLDESYESVKKSMEMDENNLEIESNKNVLIEISTIYFNQAVTFYNDAVVIGNLSIGMEANIVRELLGSPGNVVTVEGNIEKWVFERFTFFLEDSKVISWQENTDPVKVTEKEQQEKIMNEAFKNASENFETFWEIMNKLGAQQYYVIDFLDENDIKMSSIRKWSGYCAREIKKLDKAKLHFSKIVDLEGDATEAREEGEPSGYIYYAEVLNELGEFYEAIEVINRGRELWPDNKNLTVKELTFYLEAGKTNELATKLMDAIREDPTNINLHTTYAYTLDEITKSYTERAENFDTLASNAEEAGKKGEMAKYKAQYDEEVKKANEYREKSVNAYKKAIDVSHKYKNEVKYKVTGTSPNYEVSYNDEKGEKHKETVISDWEYPFNVNRGTVTYISAKAIKKKSKVTVTISLAGNLIKEAKNEGKSLIATANHTITKEDIENNDFLFDLHYNLGVLYYNPASGVYNESIKERDPDKLKALEAEYNELFDKALPFLEKAHEYRPTDKSTLRVLLKIYLLKGDPKVSEINKKLKAIK